MSFLNQPLSISALLFGKKRQFGDFSDFTVINEEASDVLTITKQPVQQGAMISDHAYLEPVKFSTTIMFRDDTASGGDSLKDIYEDLQVLQASMTPFEIVTPKRTYYNMMMTSLGQTTDKNTENCLSIRMSCEEVIIVSIGTVQVSRSAQGNAGATGRTEKAGRKSALAILAGG